MRLRQCGRPGFWTGTAPNVVYDEHPTTVPRRPQPRCELYGVNLVDEFPRRCLLRTPNPLTTLGGLREAAFRELGRVVDADHSGALELLDQLDTCGPCLDANLTHRTVRRLREELGLNQ